MVKVDKCESVRSVYPTAERDFTRTVKSDHILHLNYRNALCALISHTGCYWATTELRTLRFYVVRRK